MSKTKLTPKMERFAEQVALGDTLADAYRKAYEADSMQSGSIYREASLLAADPRIAQRVEDIRAEKRQAEYALGVSDRERSLRRLRYLVDNAASEQVQLNAAVWLGKTEALFTEVRENRDGNRTAADIRREMDAILEAARQVADDMSEEDRTLQ